MSSCNKTLLEIILCLLTLDLMTTKHDPKSLSDSKKNSSPKSSPDSKRSDSKHSDSNYYIPLPPIPSE